MPIITGGLKLGKDASESDKAKLISALKESGKLPFSVQNKKVEENEVQAILNEENPQKKMSVKEIHDLTKAQQIKMLEELGVKVSSKLKEAELVKLIVEKLGIQG